MSRLTRLIPVAALVSLSLLAVLAGAWKWGG